MNTPSVQHTRTRGQFVPGCVCPVGVHPLLSTVTASPWLCTTAEQIFVRSGANRQGAVREPGWEGQARPRGLEPFRFAGGPWKYSGNNACKAFPALPALSSRGHQGIRRKGWSSCFLQTGPSPGHDSGEAAGTLEAALRCLVWCDCHPYLSELLLSSQHSTQTACPAVRTVSCPQCFSFSAHPGSVISRASAPGHRPTPLSLNDWQAHKGQARIIIRRGTGYFHRL